MFIPHLNATRDIVYDDAIALCEASGGSLAEIHNIDDEVALNDYMSGKLPEGRTYVYLWMGMRYNYEVTIRAEFDLWEKASDG